MAPLSGQLITPVQKKFDMEMTVSGHNNNHLTNNNNMLEDDQISPVSDFYRGRSIFITGATGFMGKVLVEKILRSCVEVKTVYVLLREKKSVHPQQRLEDLLNGTCFDRLRREQPDFMSKLVAIQGDICAPGMGISSSDLDTLVEHVSIVFHSAATVKFDEPLKSSVETNLLGTRKLVEICHRLKNLESLVHVSTAYCNCDRDDIEEIIYSPPMTPQHIIDTVEWMDDDLLNTITPKLISGRPNTYTFTKALAEGLLLQESGGLPVAIVRPSIVTAAWKEPYPGWVDNMNGPTGLLVAASKGVLRSMLIHQSIKADFIPVDLVINLMLAVACHTATNKPNSIQVYNCTSGNINPITWGDLERIAFPLVLKIPSEKVFRYPGGSFKTSRITHTLCIMFQHYLPAGLADLVSLVKGHKPRFVRLYGKIHKAVTCLEYFTTHEWTFRCSNVQRLGQQLTLKDKQLFNFAIEELNWDAYMEDYLLGIRSFFLKEEVSTLPEARKKLKRMYVTGQITNLFVFIALWRLLMLRSEAAKKLWFLIIKLALKLYSLLPLPSIQ